METAGWSGGKPPEEARAQKVLPGERALLLERGAAQKVLRRRVAEGQQLV
jgi:hypothetical protein